MNRRDILKTLATLPFMGLLPLEIHQDSPCDVPKRGVLHSVDLLSINDFHKIIISWKPQQREYTRDGKYFRDLPWPEVIMIDLTEYLDDNQQQIQHWEALLGETQQANDCISKVTITEVVNAIHDCFNNYTPIVGDNVPKFTIHSVTFKLCWINTKDI